ncbi:MAG: hypothetical protein IKB38_02805 [Clostridia bacterium]|nr:hypothetical protein [Clostridia bacterium]
MKWDRERYIAHSLFEDTGREMFCELFGPLHVLEKEWRMQGASEKEIGMSAFDWDYVPSAFLAGETRAKTDIAVQILEDTPEMTLAIDTMGRHTKLIKKTATIPLPLDYPVATPDDWEKVKHWYTFTEDRVNREKLLEQKKRWENGELTMIGILGAFDEPRQLLGEAEVCLACYEYPEMLHDMLDTFADTAIKVIERVGETVPIDCLVVHEDMAGKSGPLFGPAQIREFFKPYYSRVWEAAKAYGAKLFSMDSDGDMSPIYGELIECGLNCIHPVEPVGGNDMVELRKKYGKSLCFKGGIDKHALIKGKEAVRRELEYRLSSNLMGGGTIFGLDHRIPNGVHIDTYRYYVDLGREMLGLEPICAEGWARMAF